MTALPEIDEIIENFELLDDWDDRYRYLIELGDMLPDFAEDLKTRENKVQGCVSQVWVTSEVRSESGGPALFLFGDSDAHIVRGLMAVTFSMFSGRKPNEILSCDETGIFNKLGLSEHISRQRSNGLMSLVARIKADAEAAKPV